LRKRFSLKRRQNCKINQSKKIKWRKVKSMEHNKAENVEAIKQKESTSG